MRIRLDSGARKFWLLTISLSLATAYTALVTREFVADLISSRGDLASLRTAAKLDPGNALYRHRLGRYFELIEHDAQAAAQQYTAAAQLNPHAARYWLDLAAAYQFLDKPKEQTEALENGLHADPTTPDVAWQAANVYLVQGETEKALRQFRSVLLSDASLSTLALQLCWRANPDVDALLQNVIPARPDAYIAFLEFLTGKKQTAGAAKVWSALAQTHQPFEARHAFDYIKYLIAEQEIDQARLVWQQTAALLGYSAYLTSSSNLIVNGNFGLDVLNGGFDWNYTKQNSVELMLDPSDFHGGHRSLSIVFDGPGVSDAGIFQFIPIHPNTTYEFQAYYKAEEIEGAGGPLFTLHDPYSGKKYFESDELKNADFWRPVNGVFTTAPEATLLLLRVERVPAGSPIRGKLWIDDFHLIEK
jgi:tetratricopeptide (TPR) repeat protein